MKRASSTRAVLTRASLAAAASLASMLSPARADEANAQELVVMPAECVPFWTIPGGDDSPAAWNQLLSFATCIQDATLRTIDDPDQLAAIVDEMHEALVPAIEMYVAAIDQGPPLVKLRAAYHLGLAHASLMTRARLSIAQHGPRGRALREQLEPRLVRPARIAWIMFSAIELAAAGDPSLMPDEVTRHMVTSARTYARLLAPHDRTPSDRVLLAAPAR